MYVKLKKDILGKGALKQYIRCHATFGRENSIYDLKWGRVARFIWGQTYQNGKNIPNDHKLNQTAINYTKMTVKYSKWS
jgi:hypothetical protein